MQQFHFALLLALEGATIDVFSALDMILFFLFWELTLPPIFFFLSGLWGIGPKRRSAAMMYTLFMLFGGVPLLFAIILLAINHAVDMNVVIPQTYPSACWYCRKRSCRITSNSDFLLLLFGFAVKAPIIPFHTWLPTAALAGPTQITALLVGLKLVQYQSCGLVIIGIASLNMQGIQGAIFQLFNFTLVASSLMLVAGFIQHRLGSTEAIHLGCLAKVMPRLTSFYFIFVLASIGIPGTNALPAKLLLIMGALTAHPSLGITAPAGVLSAAYMLSFTRRAFFVRIIQSAVNQAQDLRPRELALLCVPALLILVFGFFPNNVLKLNQKTAAAGLFRLVDQPALESIKIEGLTARS
ncbi:MAG: proton-conducting transporter membrane subunit [Methylococcales bacterium]|nr:proton-conducting transporter membrane subunit [Methylococcales bacterium]